jgi:hypothetical protein
MAKERTMEELKKKLGSNEALKTSSRHYVKIPLSKEHSGHPVGESSSVNQIIDKRIIERIYELAKKNVIGLKEVKQCLDEFVEKELFFDAPKDTWPKKTNRRYYPSSKDLRNHISRAIATRKYCNYDQESLLRKITDLSSHRQVQDSSKKANRTVLVMTCLVTRAIIFFLFTKKSGNENFC